MKRESLSYHKYFDKWHVINFNTRKNSETDKIYGRFSIKEKRINLSLAIGLDVADILNYKRGDKVSILSHCDDTYLLQIKKSTGDFGKITFCQPERSKFLYLGFKWDKKGCVKLNMRAEIKYDFFDDYSLILDLSDLICLKVDIKD